MRAGCGGVRWQLFPLFLSLRSLPSLCQSLATNGPEGAGFAELYTPSSAVARALNLQGRGVRSTCEEKELGQSSCDAYKLRYMISLRQNWEVKYMDCLRKDLGEREILIIWSDILQSSPKLWSYGLSEASPLDIYQRPSWCLSPCCV